LSEATNPTALLLTQLTQPLGTSNHCTQLTHYFRLCHHTSCSVWSRYWVAVYGTPLQS